MTEAKKTIEKQNLINFSLYIMKALGWFIGMHKDIKKNEIAGKMNIDPAVISRAVISPKEADSINKENYKDYNKRLIDVERATKICRCMNTTLENVLYYYQFRKILVNSTELDKLEKLTNKLTDSLNGQESLEQVMDCVRDLGFQNVNISPNMMFDSSNLISNVEHPDFTPWFGKYYCYFSSTSSEEAGKKRKQQFDRLGNDPELKELLECAPEDYIFCGILNIHSRDEFIDHLCHVDFKFLANPTKKLIKRYSGTLTLSANTKAMFCELANHEQGEKSYFIFEKQDSGNAQPDVKCCVAMVLTYSSKVHRRRPCCERMIISSSEIREGTEEYETMKAYLRMNDSIIRITDWGYEELIKDIKQSEDPELLKIADIFPNLQSLDGKNAVLEKCAFIPESVIYTFNSLTDSQKRKFEILLRIHSIAPWYCKTKATKADVLFKLLNDLHDS